MFKRPFQFVLLCCLTIPLIIYTLFCGLSIHKKAEQRAAIKKDFAYVNSIHSGLLNVDVWRREVLNILSIKIDSFNFSAEQEAMLKEDINRVLEVMVAEAQRTVNDQQTIKGKMKKVAVNTFVDWNDVRQKIPGFSQLILDEIKKPQTRDNIKTLVSAKVEEFASEIYENDRDSLALQNIYTKYNYVSKGDFNAGTENTIAEMQSSMYMLTYTIVGILLFFLFAWGILYRLPALRQPFFILSALLALIVLIIGLILPMIEIDARIDNLDFAMLGDHMQFNDQVLFLQSKSILDVVGILLGTYRPDSILVGILILVFSILFPVSKLIATEIYLLGNDRLRKSRFIQFMAFRSGKWSMADVMVVAIFMAYIGFKNVLEDQLSYLNVQTDSLTTITTNDTNLQPGYIIFISFVIFSLILSEILKRITAHAEKQSNV